MWVDRVNRKFRVVGGFEVGDGGEVRRRGAGDLPVGPTVARGERGVVSG